MYNCGASRRHFLTETVSNTAWDVPLNVSCLRSRRFNSENQLCVMSFLAKLNYQDSPPADLEFCVASALPLVTQLFRIIISHGCTGQNRDITYNLDSRSNSMVGLSFL